MKRLEQLLVFGALIAIGIIAGAAPVIAQTTEWKGNFGTAFKVADPLAHAFFPPELVMKHQQTIGLTTNQRAAIVRAIQAAQPRFIEAQWQIETETAALSELVRGARVDEARVLQQIDRVLDLERQMKRAQIELLVRIKNELTEPQQEQLAQVGGVKLFGEAVLEKMFGEMKGFKKDDDNFSYSLPKR